MNSEWYQPGAWEPEDRAEKLENIRARLHSYTCSFCGHWITKLEKRPVTCALDDGMCTCSGRGIHNSRVPDVNDEDVEWLLDEVRRLQNEREEEKKRTAAVLKRDAALEKLRALREAVIAVCMTLPEDLTWSTLKKAVEDSDD